ncbi:hypothetical protein CAPTEDRAFT_188608 [Capitella teleta]|uniref:G-protein coupled receptors family 1 profile domain-containing protein n=1 Tax=Capitella teleta TaxID=283909 RepID=R7TBG7_CAPTE|nr:hypothetical protein CAPTEDRAFT_188608 [Capitella teleta]|eukprot:ELT88446.1 hypothetical protein CAPTEDRAFT_188608 [Capitella teleta]
MEPAPIVPSDYYPWHILASTSWFVVYMIVCLSIILLNALTLGIVLKEKLAREASRNVFLTNLLVSNTSGGTALAMMVVLYAGKGDDSICLLFIHLNMWNYQVNTSSLICLMADQLIAIVYPLRHTQLLSSKVIGTATVLIWVAPVIHSLVFAFGIGGHNLCFPLLTKENMRVIGIFLLVTLDIIPITLALIFNIPILIIARKKIQEVWAVQISSTANGPRNSFLQIWRSILTTTIMVGTMVLTAGPFCLVIVLVISSKTPYPHGRYADFERICQGVLSISVNYLVSPFIYAWKIPQVKRFYLKMFMQLKCKGE